MTEYCVGSCNPSGMIPGEAQHVCVKCGGPSWCSPRGTAKIRQGFTPLCFDCALEMNPELDNATVPTLPQIRADMMGSNDN